LTPDRIQQNQGCEIVHPIELTLIKDFLNETADYRFAPCCHDSLYFQQTSGTLSNI
jgi:hypothetical protein